ncbi:hypothetical protein EVA_17826 [gut metagenome]|uniref:Uncharacterized protein n=1 Tax=gut metagenome TaxID=749906 RepID=J9FWX8_9ZZZZ
MESTISPAIFLSSSEPNFCSTILPAAIRDRLTTCARISSRDFFFSDAIVSFAAAITISCSALVSAMILS